MMKGKTFLALIMLALFGFSMANAQTLPSPFDLSSGSYSLNSFDPATPAGSYPTSMIFHRTATQDPGYAVEMTTNYTAAYNLTGGARINGMGVDGISFLNTSSSGNIGAAVLGLNTLNRNSIVVSWKGGVIAQQPRIYAIRLQYKIGAAGTFADVLDANNMPVELVADSTKPSGKTGYNNVFTVTLPQACENQSEIYLRWKYYYISGSGGRPQLKLDDILVSSQNSIGVTSNLSILNVNPPSPMSNFPFSITVNSTDANGVPKFAAADIPVTIAVTSGNPADLTGTLTGTIPAGSYSVTISNLIYKQFGTITLQANAAGLSPATRNVTFIEGPSKIAFVNVYPKLHIGLAAPKFQVQAQNDLNLPVANYHNLNVTLAVVSGPGTMTGTLVKPTNLGIAEFNDIAFDTPGTYVVSATAPGFAQPITTSFTVNAMPALEEVIIPKFLKGKGDFETRTPTYALVRLTNLHPNTTYRFIVGGNNDINYNFQTGTGAGNNIHFDAATNTFSYNSLRNISNPGEHSTLTTGANETSKTFWVNMVPTTNGAFNEGNQVFWILALGNEFGTKINNYRTVATSQALNYGSSPVQATGIYDVNSRITPRHYIAIYGTDANIPVSTTIVQNEGSTLITPGFVHQGPSWAAPLDDMNGAWATFIPNDMPAGIQKINEYDEFGNLVKTWTDSDGFWAGVSTVNPMGGITYPINFETPYLKIEMPFAYDELCNDAPITISWESHGVSKLNIEVSVDGGLTWNLVKDNVDATQGFTTWDAPRHVFSNRPLSFRLTSVEHNYISSIRNNTILWDTPVIIDITKSQAYCKNETTLITVVADGSDLKYQWKKDGVDIIGATQNLLELKNMDYDVSADYTCLVWGHDVCPSELTEHIEVYVARVTEVVKQPVSVTMLPGGRVEFSAEAHIHPIKATNKINVQWYKDGVALVDNDRIAGSKSTYLTIRNVNTSDVSSHYYIVFNGLCQTAAVESNHVSLTLADLAFVKYSLDTNICENSPLELNAEAQTTLNDQIAYQWYKDGNMLADNSIYSGTETSKLSIGAAIPSVAGKYYAVAKLVNANFSLKGNDIIVGINKIPAITVQPEANIAVTQDAELKISVVANGAAPLTYQWYKDGAAIQNATLDTYTVDKASLADTGTYKVIVKNDCGEVSSNEAYVLLVVKQYTSVNDDVLPGAYMLMPVTPNPASTTATVAMWVPEQTNVRLSISDITGRELVELFNGTANIGRQEFKIDVDKLNLTNGVYILNMSSSKVQLNEKIIISK